MPNPFFDHPILNTPYECPRRHWELDSDGQPTQQIVESRRRAEFIMPIPKPKKRKKAAAAQQDELVFDEGKSLSTAAQQYDPTSIINQVRQSVDSWRALPNPSQWQVTPESARLLQHWRLHSFCGVRPFFCQVEAAETAIWLIEVASQTKGGMALLEHLASANKDANPDLMRLALKLATGAGKTTVMAMLIAWQTINAVRRPTSKHFTRGFLICAPGLTIKDRLRVLQPNDPDSYYKDRELVPNDMMDDMTRAKIVVTNYHAFKMRERIELSKGGRQLLQGRTGVRIGQRVARNCLTAKAHVIQPLGLGTQIELDIAQRLAICQLGKGHREKLIQATEALDLVFAPVRGHAASEGAQRQVGHQLRKHELALVHGGPSRANAKDHESELRRSNRHQTETPNSANKSLTYDVLM